MIGVWAGLVWLGNMHRQRVLVNTAINLCVPQNAKNFLANWATTSFSRAVLLHELYCEIRSNLRYPMLATPHSKQSSITAIIACEIMNDKQKGSLFLREAIPLRIIEFV